MEECIPKEFIKPLVKSYNKGTYIYMEGDPALHVYFIIEGRIKIENIGPSKKRITKSILSNGDLFGEMVLFEEKERNDYAFALEDTTIHSYTKEIIKKVLLTNNKFQLLLLNNIANQVRSMEQRITSMIFTDSRSRVIEYLVQLGRKEGERIGFDTLLRNRLTHQEIAYYTGTSRQTVNVVLNELQDQNLIYYNRKRLLIRDIDRLAERLSPKKISYAV